MTNKPAPQRSSPFVPNVLRALREFDERWGVNASSSEGGGVNWKDGVVLTVCTRYCVVRRSEEYSWNILGIF